MADMAARFTTIEAEAAYPDISVASVFHCAPILIALRIDNIQSIAKAYGEAAALAAQQHLETAVAGLATTHVADRALGRLDAALVVPGSPDHFTRQLRSVLARSPIRHLDNSIFLTVSSAWSAATFSSGADISPAGFAALHDALGVPPPACPDAARYRRDMAIAAQVFTAAAEGRLFPAWQAVSSEDDTLYHECLLRLVGDDTPAVGDAIAALERTGLVRAFDQIMVSHVLDELETDPAVRLGVNISAASAVLDSWWDDALARLRSNPATARRLVVEITETAAFASISSAARFTSALRELGCRIAIDDFGVGFSSVRSVLALSPDYVKVDAFFLRRAGQSARCRNALAHMIGLAGTMAAGVIVEGVETEADSRLVASLGADWQQGHHVHFPSTLRPWIARRKAPAAASGFASTMAASEGTAFLPANSPYRSIGLSG
jgi:EAL domain-containing protein (putative c-di-GMP-specific phosphodiesterase class I)